MDSHSLPVRLGFFSGVTSHGIWENLTGFINLSLVNIFKFCFWFLSKFNRPALNVVCALHQITQFVSSITNNNISIAYSLSSNLHNNHIGNYNYLNNNYNNNGHDFLLFFLFFSFLPFPFYNIILV